MASKYYAVRKGIVPGIYRTWDECKEQVNKFPGAEYKSFKTEEEARTYMGGAGEDNIYDAVTGQLTDDGGSVPDTAKKTSCRTRKSGINGDNDTIHNKALSESDVVAYVDGSYNVATAEFSYGMVILCGGQEMKFSEKFADAGLASMRNVAGEIKGAEAAIRYALSNGYKSITIFYDYQGIEKWCTGEWKTNKDGTKAYKKYCDKAKKKLEIMFVKVASHTNNKYNDMADALAKEALNIT